MVLGSLPGANRTRMKLERTVGIEPTTGCLEGTDSTTELRPRSGSGRDVRQDIGAVIVSPGS